MRAATRRWASAGVLVVALPLMADSCGEPINGISVKRVELIVGSTQRANLDMGARPLDTTSQEGNYTVAAGSAGSIEIEFGSASSYDACTLDFDGQTELKVEPSEPHFVVRKSTPALMTGRTVEASLRCVNQAGLAVPTIAYFTVRTVTRGIPTLSPVTIDFGAVDLGTTSRSAIVRLKNKGDTEFRTTRPWTDRPKEILISGTGCTTATVSGPGFCTFTVQVKPEMTGAFTGHVGVDVFDVGAQAQPVTIAAKVVGTAPILVMNPSSLDFGRILTGSTATQVLRATNTGSSPLIVNSVAWTGSGNIAIRWSMCTSRQVAPNDSCEVEVRFSPSSAGLASGQLVFTGTMAASPMTVNVSGTGYSVDPVPEPTYSYPTPP